MADYDVHVQNIETRLVEIGLVLGAAFVRLLHPGLDGGRGVHDAQHGLGAAETVVLADVLVREEVQVDALHGAVDGGEPGAAGAGG